jgi:hypothetical protein
MHGGHLFAKLISIFLCLCTGCVLRLVTLGKRRHRNRQAGLATRSQTIYSFHDGLYRKLYNIIGNYTGSEPSSREGQDGKTTINLLFYGELRQTSCSVFTTDSGVSARLRRD